MAFEQMSLQWNFKYILYMFWPPVGDLFQDSEQELQSQVESHCVEIINSILEIYRHLGLRWPGNKGNHDL